MTAQNNLNSQIEPHEAKSGQKLNWLRASVLGANDGIVSTASLETMVLTIAPDLELFNVYDGAEVALE